MRKTCVFMLACVLAVMMSECAFGMYQNIYGSGFSISIRVAPQNAAGINLDSVEKLIQRAMSSKSGDKGNDPEAQYTLGVIFYTMYNAAQNEASAEDEEAKSYATAFNLNQAAYWLRRAARNDYAPAMFLLGYINFWCLGENEEGALWFDRAVEAGYPRAQAIRAEILLNELWSKADGEEKYSGMLNKALELAAKSAEQGDALGMYELSRIYKHTPIDDRSKAEEWLKKAREAARNDPAIKFHDR